MGIVFFCQSCGARFEVDPKLAGKRGHCKRCGQLMEIPRAEHLASMASIPALTAAYAGAAAPAMAAKQAEPAAAGGLLEMRVSQVGLAPLTVDRMRFKRPAKPSPLDDAADSKPYVLAKPLQVNRGRAKSHDYALLRFWRRHLGNIQKLFRKINQTAYFFSIPFIMILLFGAIVKSRSTALLGATGVVLLNIGRIVAGVANLAVIPFRDGINFSKMKKPLWRVIEPVVTIVVVVAAFTFIPWLSGGAPAKGTLTERLSAGAASLREEVEGKVESAADKAKGLDLEKLGAAAQEKLKALGSKSGDESSKDAGAGEAAKSPESALGGLIKDVGDRAREAIKEAQKQP
jgi:hypothetical protein